jgi:hypothetical protein
VTFVLPDVGIFVEARVAKHSGMRPRALDAFSTSTLPVGPGRSALVRIGVSEQALARWFPRPKGAPQPSPGQYVLSSSQTSAEAQPRLRALVFTR